MADRKAERLLQRWDDMDLATRQWRTLWQEVADYMLPRKSNIAYERSAAAQQTDVLFDSTAQHANELLAASMQGALTSSAFRWFSLRIRGVELPRDHAVNQLLEWCSDDMNDAIEQSNFQAQSHEVYLDLPSIGTAALFVEERPVAHNVPPGALRFTALPPGSFAIDENEEGGVDVVFRKFKLSARSAAHAFGRDVLGQQIQAALTRTPAQRFEFLHAVYPRAEAALPGRGRLPANKKPWASLWVDISGRVTVRESGYDEPPIMVPRWATASGEIYGRGPGITALPDVKTLNKAVELKLKAWAKVVDPPMKVRDEGIVGIVRLQNGGITYVRDMDAIQALTDLGGRLDVAEMEEEKLRASIRRMFFADQLQLQEGPQMTAYEVQVRYELMQRILGPTLGRTNVEYLNPLISRIFWIRLRASEKNSRYRQLEAWARTNGVVLDIEYEGPLAKAQRLQESVAIQRVFQLALPLAQTKPEVLDNYDLDYAARHLVDSVGAPTQLLRDAKQVAEIRQARTQAQEQKNALDAAATAARAGGDFAPLLQAMNQTNGGQPGSLQPQAAPILAGAVAA